MNNNFKDKKIPKEIFDAISLSKKETLFRPLSTTLIYPKNLILISNEDMENDDMKEMESTKEYKIGNYMVQYTLGRGTFGKVKLGVYLPNNEKVAIKILEKNRIVEKDDEIRVKREFDMLAQFNHPNVILVAEIFESEDSFYSVMEFCEGGELFNYIVKKTRLSEDESAYFFYQLICGLEYIHSLGIVHRDLKPENLLLTSDHILKIIDFGLSNYFKENQEPLLSTPCGSPCYASPEMVAGKKYDGFKIDVWSCGIILYAMLCGYLPFEDPDNEVLFKKILECNLEFPSYVKELSIDLINKILVTDPEKRITIPEIKKHPFYLKGKEIFEQEFSTTLIVRSPKEKNNEENEKTEEKEKVEENKENINNVNEHIEVNKEKIDNKNENIKENKEIKEMKNEEIKPKLIEINLDNKENINIENINEKEKEKNIESDKKDKEIKNNEKMEKKEEKEEKEEKDNLEKIEKEKKSKKLEKQKIKKEDKDKVKNKIINDKKDIKEKKENKENKENKEKEKILNKNIILTEQEEIYIPLKTEYTNSNYRLPTNENIKEEKNEKKNINISKKNSNFSKENQRTDFDSKINSQKLKYKGKQKEKKKEKEKEQHTEKEKKIKEKIDKSTGKKSDKNKENIKQKLILERNKEEKLNEKNRDINLNSKINNQESKRTITPKKKINNFKNIKTQRPSNLTNITKNINLNIKGKTLKYIEQKNNKLVSAKEPLKIKSTFKNLNINLNQFTHYPSQQIKGIFNDVQNYKKIILDKNKENKDINNHYLNTEVNKNKSDLKDFKIFKDIKSISKNKKRDLLEENKWQRLNTEYIQNKNKNYLENKRQINYINNTIDSIKNSIGFISDVKKNVLENKINNNRNKYDINLHLNARRDKRKNNDIKRIKSTTFSENNTNNNTISSTYNNTSTIKSHLIPKNQIGKKLLNRLQILTNKNNNEIIYGPNNINFSNRKSTYESELCDNIVKTEPSSEFFLKLNNKDNHFNHFKTNKTIASTLNSNTNTIQSTKLHRGLYPKKLNYNYNYPASYFRYLNSIKKVSRYPTNRNTNNLIKNIPNNDLLKNPNIKERRTLIPKSKENSIITKKNPIFTIRNTVINVNMIETGLILPPYNKKTLDRKKYNLLGSYNTQSQMHPSEKYPKEQSELYNQKTFNNSIKKIPNLNNSTFRPLFKNKTIITNHCNNHSLTINQNNKVNDLLYPSRRLKTQTIIPENKISSISSFNKLVTKMKNKQLYNKRHSNSVEKNHNIFKSIKLNEYYMKNLKPKNERKTLEINTGLSNTFNNINNNFRSINANKNFNLPSLIIKTKRSFKPKQQRFLIPPQGKTLRIVNPMQTNTLNDNYKKYYIKGLN